MFWAIAILLGLLFLVGWAALSIADNVQRARGAAWRKAQDGADPATLFNNRVAPIGRPVWLFWHELRPRDPRTREEAWQIQRWRRAVKFYWTKVQSLEYDLSAERVIQRSGWDGRPMAWAPKLTYTEQKQVRAELAALYPQLEAIKSEPMPDDFVWEAPVPSRQSAPVRSLTPGEKGFLIGLAMIAPVCVGAFFGPWVPYPGGPMPLWGQGLLWLAGIGMATAVVSTFVASSEVDKREKDQKRAEQKAAREHLVAIYESDGGTVPEYFTRIWRSAGDREKPKQEPPKATEPENAARKQGSWKQVRTLWG